MHTAEKIQDVRTRLLTLLHKRPKSSREIALEIGVSSLVISRFLRGETTPNLKSLLKIENYLEGNSI